MNKEVDFLRAISKNWNSGEKHLTHEILFGHGKLMGLSRNGPRLLVSHTPFKFHRLSFTKHYFSVRRKTLHRLICRVLSS